MCEQKNRIVELANEKERVQEHRTLMLAIVLVLIASTAFLIKSTLFSQLELIAQMGLIAAVSAAVYLILKSLKKESEEKDVGALLLYSGILIVPLMVML